VLCPEIEATGRSTKGPSTLNDIHTTYFIFKRITKKNQTLTLLFSFAEVTVKCQFSNLQFSNFKASVVASSLVETLLVLEGSIIPISKVYESLKFTF
jgi:hypothetical protein